MNVVDDPTVRSGDQFNALLETLTALRNGDASVRLPLHSEGVASKVAEVFNEVVDQNADHATALEHAHLQTRGGQIARTGQAVVAGADDQDVVVLVGHRVAILARACHGSFRRAQVTCLHRLTPRRLLLDVARRSFMARRWPLL
jgi:hypothetical protein